MEKSIDHSGDCRGSLVLNQSGLSPYFDRAITFPRVSQGRLIFLLGD